MNVSIWGDGILVLWQVLVLAWALAVLLIAVPMILWRLGPEAGEDPGRIVDLAGRTFLAAVAAGVGACVALFIEVGVLDPHLAVPDGILGALALLLAPALVSLGIAYGILAPVVPRTAARWKTIPSALVLVAVAGCFVVGLHSLERARTIGKRSADGSSLNSLGKGLELYAQEHGAYPRDLRRLVDTGMTSRSWLLSLFSLSRDHPAFEQSVAEGDPYRGPVDWVYVYEAGGRDERLVWAWQPPADNDGEGGWALYNDFSVEWFDAAALADEVARTMKWLNARELEAATQPAD